MAELPIILAHNVLDGATLSGNGIAGHEEERLRDGNRHTWWQAPSASTEYIQIECKNLIVNPDFENGISDWLLHNSGGGVSEMSQNTASPISGTADLEIVVTDADDTDKSVRLFQTKALFFRAGRTYRIAMVAKCGATLTDARIGFLDANLAEVSSRYLLIHINDVASGYYFDYTPSADDWYMPYIRLFDPQTYHFDNFQCGEAREVDTIIIDRGHTLRWGAIAAHYRDSQTSGYSNALATTLIRNDAPIYLTFNGVRALCWRIAVTPSAITGGAPVSQLPLLFLGKRWELPRHFSGGFDPHQDDISTDDVVSDRGILRRAHKFNRRIFRASMNHISATEYENVKLFFEDTENGLKPFCFLWKPVSDPTDLLIMRLAGGRNAPYTGGALRTWRFDASEVVGQRVI